MVTRFTNSQAFGQHVVNLVYFYKLKSDIAIILTENHSCNSLHLYNHYVRTTCIEMICSIFGKQ